MDKCFLIFFLLSNTLFGFESSQSDIKKLQGQLSNTERLLEKVDLYEKLAIAYYSVNTDSTKYYANLLIEYGEKYNDSLVLAKGYQKKGVAFKKSGDLKGAIGFFYDALRIREKLGDTIEIVSTNLSIGNVYFSRGGAFELNNEYDRADSSYAAAERYYRSALQLSLLRKDSATISKAYQNLGSALNRLFKYNEAINHYNLSYNWTPHEGKLLVYGELKSNVLFSLYELGEQDNIASDLYNELVSHFKKYQQIEQWINFNLNSANVMWTKDSKRAILLLLEADSLSQKSKNVEFRIKANQSLYELNKEIGAYDLALHYLEIVKKLNTNLTNTSTDLKIKDLNLKYNQEKLKKDLAIEKVSVTKARSEKNTLLIAFVGLLFIAIGLLALFIQRQRINKLRRKQDREQYNNEVTNLLKNQELKSIGAMIEGQDLERKRIATDLHDRLGSTLSATKMYFEATMNTIEHESDKIDKVYHLIDTAIQDTRYIAQNLISGTLSKFGLFAALNDLKSTIEAAELMKVNLNFDVLDFEARFHSKIEINIYRIVQEALSNTIKHSKASSLTIRFTQKEHIITVLIFDNGVGFNIDTIHKGMGLKNIKARVGKLNGKLILQSNNNNGTEFQIILNLKDFEKENNHSR